MKEITKIGLITLGCDKNRVDGEKLLALALSVEHTVLTGDAEDADIIIINTCSFLQSSVKESLDAIFDMATIKARTGARIIVTGCLPNRYFDDVKKDMDCEIDYLLRLEDNHLIKSIVTDIINESENLLNFENSVKKVNESALLCDIIDVTNKSQKNLQINTAHSYLAGENERILTTPPHMAYLKIADGCSNFCTYCAIPYIRGRYISTDIDTLLSEAKGLIANYGVKELNLVAQDVTKYGYDLYGKSMLIELLDKLSELEVDWIRLNYCYPELITDELLEYISKNPKICKYLDIPMQHVSTRILKLMNRKSDNESLSLLIDKIRKICPEMSLRSSFIVGFPTETEQDFEELKQFILSKQLDNAGFFSYSKEEGTPASRMKGQIAEKIKKERLKAIVSEQSNIMAMKMQDKIGKNYKILCDGIDYDRGVFYGRMEYDGYSVDKKVYFTSKNVIAVGEFTEVTINSINKIDYLGETK